MDGQGDRQLYCYQSGTTRFDVPNLVYPSTGDQFLKSVNHRRFQFIVRQGTSEVDKRTCRSAPVLSLFLSLKLVSTCQTKIYFFYFPRSCVLSFSLFLCVQPDLPTSRKSLLLLLLQDTRTAKIREACILLVPLRAFFFYPRWTFSLTVHRTHNCIDPCTRSASRQGTREREIQRQRESE